MIRQLLRREDAPIWMTGVVSGAMFFGHFTPTLAGFANIAFHSAIGATTAMAVTSGFRGADLLRRARDRKAIARQQQEIRDEGALPGYAGPDPAGPASYRWSLESQRDTEGGGDDSSA